jgi:uncharacterized protein
VIRSSALYRGAVMHQRLRPKRHRLSYRAFWLLLDLDEIDPLDSGLRLFSRNRFNLFSFHDRDHGDGSWRPLRRQIDDYLAAAGVDLDGGPIRLLTMPRVLGYVFNPISIYYCHQADGRLAAVVYEVTSTFRVRHSYVIPVTGDGAFRQVCGKALHVSPFIGMDIDYAFRGWAPADDLALAIDAADASGLLLSAVMTGRRAPLSDGAIAAAAASIPLLTLKVVAAIHWEALKLWLKGVSLAPRPLAVGGPATIVRERPVRTSRRSETAAPR